MKIRNPRWIRAAGTLATTMVHGLVRTLRFELCNLGPIAAPVDQIPPGPRYVYALWHEYLLLPAAKLGHPDLAVLISKHADGQLLGALITSMGMGMVHGSTNRGGIEAVKQIVNDQMARRHLVVTPDGPRGPRRQLQPGVVYVASRTGMSLVPVGIGYQACYRLRSWDRFAIPRPGSRVVLVTGHPIELPRTLKTDGLEVARLEVQQKLDALTVAAEAWAKNPAAHPTKTLASQT